MSKTFNDMTKMELRAACKDAGIKGASSMTNDGMRQALVAKQQTDMDAKAAAEAAAKPAVVATQPATPTRTIQKERPTQFGVTRPSDGTICGDIWTALDLLRHMKAGAVPTSKELVELRDKNGWQKHTASTQFQRWRQFNSVMPRSTAGKDE